MILRGASDTNSIVLNRRTIQRLSVCPRVQWDGSGAMAPDFKAVTVKCVLNRNGKKHIIFHDNLYALALESMYFHAIEPLVLPAFSMAMGADYYLYPLMIDLGAPINLQGDDELTFEASTTSAWSGANVLAAGSTIEFEWRDAIGVEHAIPQINTKVIQGAIGKVTESLGENVTSIALINAALSPIVTDLNAIFTSIVITSDRYNINDNLDRMLSRRNSQFENQTMANWRGNCWMYRPETEIDSVQLSATMNSANVLASENYIVYRTFKTDSYTMQRGMNLEEKHADRNQRKYFGSQKAIV